jgi:hypothetical protein
MQGNCTSSAPPSFGPPTPYAPLLPLSPGQCFLLTDNSLLYVGSAEHSALVQKLWVSGLYVRHTHPIETQALIAIFYGAGVWMDDVTLQGNGDAQADCEICAIQIASSSKLLAAGDALMHGIHAVHQKKCRVENMRRDCVWIRSVNDVIPIDNITMLLATVHWNMLCYNHILIHLHSLFKSCALVVDGALKAGYVCRLLINVRTLCGLAYAKCHATANMSLHICQSMQAARLPTLMAAK